MHIRLENVCAFSCLEEALLKTGSAYKTNQNENKTLKLIDAAKNCTYKKIYRDKYIFWQIKICLEYKTLAFTLRNEKRKNKSKENRRKL